MSVTNMTAAPQNANGIPLCSSAARSPHPRVSPKISTIPFAACPCLLLCRNSITPCSFSSFTSCVVMHQAAQSDLIILCWFAEPWQDSFKNLHYFILSLVQDSVCESCFSFNYHSAVSFSRHRGHLAHVYHMKTDVVRITACGCQRGFPALNFGVLANRTWNVHPF